MSEIKNYVNSKKNIIILYIIMFSSCITLIILNYTTIRILSASRAYVNGESSYSKGQNKASRHLISYLYTENDKHWKLFEEELKIPLGDQVARVALSKNLDEDIVKRGFRAGKNKEEDLDDMIWIFKNFNSVPFLKKAIHKWENADELVNRLLKKGIEIHKKIETTKLDEQTKNKITSEINILCDNLDNSADNFSNIVGDGSREIKDHLIVLNIFFISLIISSVSFYYVITLKKIIASEKDVNKTKEQLQDIIEDLEKTKIELSTEIIQHKKLIGTISHDIKSPMKYLAMTSKYIYEESINYDDQKFKKNAKSVYSSTLQLFNFIDSLLTYSKIFIEGKSSENSVYHLRKLVQTKCNLFNEIAKASNNILVNEIDKNVITKINKDILSVILHNIIDNAIKNTENGVIKIYSHIKNKKLYLVVEDTGKGFKEDDLIHYKQLSNEQSTEKLILRNSGMGLPMIIELIHILHGNLKISSEISKGSKFEIITDLN
ncbi:sensor histidine kinase [Flavobacterium yafengii]|uniref:sensor histidine kinase n=1 Tax=Flavobacterium yafengii TaxID=3041253 RepID=UPI0024A90591|nr:HAMP domain-containing sensor histidine kinase [Flavobacterium yafengii]MDI5897155.1 HAMP domain-containing sensor histidine kinase [Flavobacterium yafengii]MDI6046130.1 HAMP domain-containing sensor histidine kinase [Flavobacterium yafengii]